MNLVTVRAKWDDLDRAEVPADALAGLHWGHNGREDPPPGAQPFLVGMAWCDTVLTGSIAHECSRDDRPHRLTVCILRTDNPAPLYRELVERVSDAPQAPSNGTARADPPGKKPRKGKTG